MSQQAPSRSVATLFRPFQCKSLTLRNRIVMAPMTRNMSPGYVPNDQVVAYYRRRAENNVGLIITEGTTVNQVAANGYEGVPAFHGEAALAGWKQVVDAVHAAGGKIAPQLWHVGAVRRPGVGPDPEVPGMGPSGISSAGKRKAHTLSEQEVLDCIEAFAQAAEDAERLGFDAIELHGAHGYLIDQFFWEVTNERTDRWGGSFAKRSQFAVDIIEAVRQRVSADFPVIFRFSQWKQQDYSARLAHTPEQLEAFLQPLSDAGVDIFHASQRRFWEPEFEGSDLNLAGWTKKLTGKPAISVGSVGLNVDFLEGTLSANPMDSIGQRGLEELLARMENEEFDMIAVGRALLQDPEWTVKVQQNRLDELADFDRAAIAKLY
ncbi:MULTISPECIES: NADH:flavin oxidoreductase [unclassified Ketobacter]|jgi:2,4-dienoyl-CoA reductase-like NADH-dependent reductase (Old Yellow Enzyme family)|uniref:NADH:flavin oxidoreductase n=1 Tax=unclassified Ketobacter TaxID=2639109 RepID=UPI000F10C182|nr:MULTISPECIES: NADH:flavin oxidoreductase [unclassified Ketobacter]MEC8811395.1 NADH:flavin oxidoreductase [Pseudomonadota bacterium]RLT91551.1 MAG: 12-oxophytodienoate reductase [Ketobacter sp. GenoA1]RLT96169.1 MAG: 12-oxophytodienoate reductase [Ketobacter sp.]